MLCGSWIRLSCWQRKRSRLLPRPSKRLTQLGSLACVGTNVFSRLPVLAKEGRMETSPAPCPAAATEPRARHRCPRGRWGRAGVSRACGAWSALSSCAGARPTPRSQRRSWSQGKAETGRLHTGRLRQPGWGGPRHRRAGHWQCEPAADGDLSVGPPVCHRAWSAALTGCQAIPLRVLRGLLVLEGKVWPFPLVSGTCPASLRNKLLPKALASEEMLSPKAAAEQQGDPAPSSLACSTGEQHDTKPTGRHQDPPRGLARIPPSSSEGTEVQQVP